MKERKKGKNPPLPKTPADVASKKKKGGGARRSLVVGILSCWLDLRLMQVMGRWSWGVGRDVWNGNGGSSDQRFCRLGEKLGAGAGKKGKIKAASPVAVPSPVDPW